MNTYFVDIDGTIANGDHRVHLAKTGTWDEYFELAHLDDPVWHMQHLLNDLTSRDGRDEPIAEIVYFSGRPERIRIKTVMWLRQHKFPNGRLFMRKDGDHRPDNIVKAELYRTYLKNQDNHQPVMVFDDRNQVVKMWREMGVPCAQVAEGDF